MGVIKGKPMGKLAEALKSLDGRPGDTFAAASEFDPLPPLDPQPALFAEPLAQEYGYEAEVGEAPVVEPEAPTGLFNDPSFNEALAFADAAIQAAEVDEMPARWPAVEMPIPTPVIDRMPESKPEPETRDHLATVAVDHSYGRLWDSLTSALLESLPWAIVVAAADSHDDASWLLPAAVAFAQRHSGDVLLVDAAADGNGANRRRLSHHLGLACRFGLSDVLQATVDWHDAVEPTAVPRVGLLAGGPISLDGDSALKAGAAKLIAELKSAYQLILIRAGDACDPLVAPLVAASDGTLLLLELGQTSRAAAERASSSLYVAGARLLGCVLQG
jgi:Mrp family chromosome partitioning ATPase